MVGWLDSVGFGVCRFEYFVILPDVKGQFRDLGMNARVHKAF